MTTGAEAVADGRLTAIYTRVSADPENDRLAVQRQQKACQERCPSGAWVLFEDDDISVAATGSRSRKRRPAYERMLAEIEAGRIGRIVVQSADRLYGPGSLERLVDIVNKHQVAIDAITSGHIDLTTADGRNFARFLAGIKQWTVEKTQERMWAKWQQTKERGLYHGNPHVYGYRYGVGGSLEIEEGQAAVIREAADRVMKGESMGSIINDFNDREVPTAMRRGLWAKGTMKRILLSARISGRVESFKNGKHPSGTGRLGEIVAEARWPAIISVEESSRLRRVLTSRTGTQVRTAVGRQPVLLLTGGIAICGLCGAPLQASRIRGGQRAMRCYASKHGGYTKLNACGRVTVSAAKVEKIVIKYVFGLIDQGKLDVVLQDPDQEAIEKRAELQARLDEADLDRAKGEMSREALLAVRRELKPQIDDLDRRIASTYATHGLDGLQGLLTREKWDGLTLQLQRKLVDVLLGDERVVITPYLKPPRNRFDPDRVQIRVPDQAMAATA